MKHADTIHREAERKPNIFEKGYIECKDYKFEPGRLWVLLIAVIVHVVLISIIIIGSVWLISYIRETPIHITLFSEMAPPPPPAPPLRTSREKEPELDPASHAETAPVDIPSYRPEINTHIDTDVSDDATKGVDWSEGGVQGGIEGGVDGGVVGGIPGGVPIPKPPDSDVIRIGLNAQGQPPVLLHQVPPDYPEDARRANIEGVVIVDAIINIDGTVDKVTILKSMNPSMDHAAIVAVKKWRFSPALMNGKPVRAYFTLTVVFRLQ